MTYTDIKSKVEHYTDRLSSNEEEGYMTTTHDSNFAAVAGLRWYPWVGKNYDKSRILILGMSAYDEEGEKTTNWRTFGENSTDMSRVLVIGKKGSLVMPDRKPFREHKPFMAMSKMFIGAAGKKYGTNTARLFWESVAFNNHCQEVVSGRSGKYKNKGQADCAFYEILNILKPKLCLVWGVGLTDGLAKRSKIRSVVCRGHKLGTGYPRVIEADGNRPPIIGLCHPSISFPVVKWRNFLLKTEASKQPTADFIAYLQSQSVE